MSINVAALLALFPERKNAPPIHSLSIDEDDEVSDTVRGRYPYERLRARAGAGSEFIAVVEAVRSHPRWGRVFDGDLSDYDGDHSRADLALCGEFARIGFSPIQIDMALRASGLYREKWERDDYRRATIAKALEGRKFADESGSLRSALESAMSEVDDSQDSTGLLDLQNGKIVISTGDPLPRDWTIDGLLLPGKSAVIGGFGGTSKTMLAMQLAVAVALGQPFSGKAVKQGGVMLLLGEEDQAEIARRVNAIVRLQSLGPEEIQLIEDNLRAFPLVGKDVRLTAKEKGVLQERRFEREVIAAANKMENVRLIVLDHLGLFHGGEFNAREDAALTMRVVNNIAQLTGASVLMVAHTPKSANQSEESDSSMISGSTAFVDQARGAWILATMRKTEAAKFKLSEEDRLEHASLTVVKNNYGPSGEVLWFKRRSYDGVGILMNIELSVHAAHARGATSLENKLLNFVRSTPGRYAKTKLRDTQSGKQKPPFNASKGEVEKAIEMLLSDGRLVTRPPTDEERKKYGLGHHVKQVLDVGA